MFVFLFSAVSLNQLMPDANANEAKSSLWEGRGEGRAGRKRAAVAVTIDKRTYGKMSKVGPFPSSYSVFVCCHSASVGLGWGERERAWAGGDF